MKHPIYGSPGSRALLYILFCLFTMALGYRGGVIDGRNDCTAYQGLTR